jgi:hypothetical protein
VIANYGHDRLTFRELRHSQAALQNQRIHSPTPEFAFKPIINVVDEVEHRSAKRARNATPKLQYHAKAN